jgi:hypothetical protein
MFDRVNCCPGAVDKYEWWGLDEIVWACARRGRVTFKDACDDEVGRWFDEPEEDGGRG